MLDYKARKLYNYRKLNRKENMPYIDEELNFVINEKKIKVFHNFDEETGRYFKDQHNGNGIQELKSIIKEDLDKGEIKGFYPYNNFESRVSWRIID
tara:strand:- start:247 stop:534 length:288 start_codon:yes stop_codon:yes gene_type:complete